MAGWPGDRLHGQADCLPRSWRPCEPCGEGTAAAWGEAGRPCRPVPAELAALHHRVFQRAEGRRYGEPITWLRWFGHRFRNEKEITDRSRKAPLPLCSPSERADQV